MKEPLSREAKELLRLIMDGYGVVDLGPDDGQDETIWFHDPTVKAAREFLRLWDRQGDHHEIDRAREELRRVATKTPSAWTRIQRMVRDGKLRELPSGRVVPLEISK